LDVKNIYETQVGKKNMLVYQCLAYFDIFRYPLTMDELHEFCGIPITRAELENVLEELLRSQNIRRHNDFYFLFSSDPSLIQTRIKHQANAVIQQSKVKKYSNLIARFPYVEGVCISGSFSKGVLSDDGDIDYFIITKPGRLWLSRSLLVLFKKIFLLNSRKYFCINYFIDSANLEIPDHNLFVATEIKTLMPVCNSAIFEEFLRKNNWSNEFLPNKNSKNLNFCRNNGRKHFLSYLIEKFPLKFFGDQLDRLFFKLTLNRWKRKFPEFSQEDFDLNLRTRKSVSKHHPRGFQKKVLEAMQERMKAFKTN
jgi:hypothetical protein